jgi:hypothetical protein
VQALEPEVVVINSHGEETSRGKLDSEGGVTALSFSADATSLAVACEHPKLAIQVLVVDTVRIRIFSVSTTLFGRLQYQPLSAQPPLSARLPAIRSKLKRAAWVQMAVLAEAALEQAAEQLQVHPLHAGCLLAVMRSSVAIFSLEMLSGKRRLIERPTRLPLATTAPTCATFYASGFYVGTTGGHIYSFSNEGMQHKGTAGPHGRDAGGAERLVLQGDDGDGLPVTLLASNSETLVIATADSNLLFVCAHAHGDDGGVPTVLSTVEVTQASVISAMVYGGQHHRDIALLSADGIQLMLCHSNTAGAVEFVPRVLSDAHRCKVTAAVATGRAGEVATAALDGSVRIWEVSLAMCSTKRTFSSPMTALAACPAAGLLAVGAASGVLRVLAATAGLPVAARICLSRLPVSDCAFCLPSVAPGGRPLLAALCGTDVFIVQLRRGGGASAVHRIVVTGRPLAVAFAPSPTADVGCPQACLLVSLAVPELMCLPLPAELTPGSLAATAEWRMKIQAAFVHMVCTTGARDTLGTLYGVCTDKYVCSYELPGTAAAWAASKGRLVRSSEKVETDGKAAGARVAIAASPHAPLLAHSSMSGFVHLRQGATATAAPRLSLGDAATGGVTAVAFDATATHLLSGGADGAVIICTVNGGMPDKAVVLVQVPEVVVDMDMDALDDAGEPLFDAAPVSLATSAPKPARIPLTLCPEQSELLARFKLLRQQFGKLLDRNAAAQEREKMPRNAFAIDTVLETDLREQGQVRIASIRQRLQRANAAMGIVCLRIRAQCHDAMDVHIRCLSGVRTLRVVKRFAASASAAASRSTAQVTFLRDVERAEARAGGSWHSVRGARIVELDTSGAPVDRGDGDDTAAPPAAPTATHDALTADGPASKVEAALYSDWDLCTSSRRVINSVLLAAASTEERTRFNAAFERAVKVKAAAIDKINEQNARLVEIAKEMASMGFAVKHDDVAPLEVPPLSIPLFHISPAPVKYVPSAAHWPII